MEWRDQGIIINIKPHGEHGGVVSLLTQNNGRHAGFTHGVQSSKNRSQYELGTLVDAEWISRREDSLGTYKLNPEGGYAAYALDDPRKHLALQSMCALLYLTLPERETCPGVFDATLAFLEALKTDIWAPTYVYWEIGLLQALGFGIDVTACAATGVTDDLCYISPKSARAVSREAGAEFHERMLPLPGFLRGEGDFDDAAVADGLLMTGYFLQHRVFGMTSNLTLPEVRHRLHQSFSLESASQN